MARLAVMFGERVFVPLISATTNSTTFDCLFLQWIDSYENMVNPKWKKCVSMALAASLVLLGSSGSGSDKQLLIEKYLGSIVGVVWIDSLTNTNISNLSASHGGDLTEHDDNDDEMTSGDQHSIRKIGLLRTDPIVKESLKGYISGRLQMLWSIPGFQQIFNGSVEQGLGEKLSLLLS